MALTPDHDPGWGDHRIRCEEYRRRSRLATMHAWFEANIMADPSSPNILPLDLTGLTPTTISYWKNHWHDHYRDDRDIKPFNWANLVDNFRPYPARFEVAIWSSGTLCGMAIGRPSRGDENVTVHFLEGFQGENPLKGHVAAIALDAADQYAKLLKKRWVYLKNPTAGAVPIYEKLGFGAVQRSSRHSYYGREVEDAQ